MISTVAVGTDGSATAATAVSAAVELADKYGAELVLLGVFGDKGWRDGDPERQWETSSSARLQQILARAEQEVSSQGVSCRTLTQEGDPAAGLVSMAEECGADVLVVGNKGMHRRVLGSVPNTVAHQAPCSVFVVKTT